MNYLWVKNALPILQLGADFYDVAKPAIFPVQRLRYWNNNVPLSLPKFKLWDFTPIENNLPKPLALRYHGHQFQHYNAQIGDGRGFLYAQFLINNQWYDLGTKGSGQTVYSRSGDGRLTLKGAMREALATEMLESLGVNTSKTMCFYETGEQLQRGDEPSPTRSAVLTRFSVGHIRIGTFQRLAYFKQTENIKKLISYCINFYFHDEHDPKVVIDENEQALEFLKIVCQRQAKLTAEIMLAGFVHGVLNSDNINISGELFDYGPYRFLPTYDPQFTAAYFDQEGLYAFGRQPHSILWNLHQLGISLSTAFPNLDYKKVLDNFNTDFNTAIQKQFLHRLNLSISELNADLMSDKNLVDDVISLFFKFMEEKKLPFEQTFFDFHSFDSVRLAASPQADRYSGPLFDSLKTNLNRFTLKDSSLKNHTYFNRLHPETLLIEEIESIWSAIDENDDWTAFEKKVNSIKAMRGVY